jgi:hypothetical protein
LRFVPLAVCESVADTPSQDPAVVADVTEVELELEEEGFVAALALARFCSAFNSATREPTFIAAMARVSNGTARAKHVACVAAIAPQKSYASNPAISSHTGRMATASGAIRHCTISENRLVAAAHDNPHATTGTVGAKQPPAHILLHQRYLSTPRRIAACERQPPLIPPRQALTPPPTVCAVTEGRKHTAESIRSSPIVQLMPRERVRYRECRHQTKAHQKAAQLYCARLERW